MIATILGLSTLIGPAATAGGHGRVVRTSAPAVCQACGVDGRASLPLIAQLQSAPRWQTRDNAAHALKKFNWRAHPEVVFALCDALLMDPKDDVREEAAEALKDMAPCVPVAHEALRQAAARDPDDDVREEAREALGRLRRHRCPVACGACGPAAGGVVIQGPDALPPAWTPLYSPSAEAVATPPYQPDLAPAPGYSPAEPPIRREYYPPQGQAPARSRDVPPPSPVPYSGPALEPIVDGPIGSDAGLSLPR